MDGDKFGRPNQKARTRKDLLQAAARLMKQGRKPSLEEVAQEALVSRATAYRYFPSMDALLVEASLDMATPDADALFGDTAPSDPVLRLQKVDEAFDRMMRENEASMRMMLARSMERIVRGGDGADASTPPRQNRRTPLIEAALAPARREFRPADFKRLCQTLALVIGTESMIVFKDVLQVDEAEARKVKQWAIQALVQAARKRE